MQDAEEMIDGHIRMPMSLKAWKYTVIAAGCALIVLCSLLSIIFARNIYVSSVVSTLLVFGYGLAIYSWCRFDSRERGFQLSDWFPYMVVLFGTLTFVYYLFRSRGFVHGMKALALFVLLVIGILFIEVILGIFLGIVMVLLGSRKL